MAVLYHSPRRDATQHCITLLDTTLMVELQGEMLDNTDQQVGSMSSQMSSFGY